MPRQGLNRERVIQAAVRRIEENGIARFSMVALARDLHVRTASLYNHVESLDRLLESVGQEAIDQLTACEAAAIAGKEGDEALFALADAYRSFARKHAGLYRVILSCPKWGTPALKRQAGEIVFPILRVLEDYGLTEERRFHWQRVFRALMAGFAFHEQGDGFSSFPVDRDESFRIAVRYMADALHQEGTARA